MKHGRARSIGLAVSVVIAAGCGHGNDTPPPDATAVAGDSQTADGGSAPAPGPVPGLAPAPAPAPGPSIEGARVLAALKGFVERPWPPVAGGPPPGWLQMHPDGVPDGASSGVFYAWSQLLHGGQATVSNVYTHSTVGPAMQLEYLVASGDAGYVANLTLRADADTIVFDEVATIAAAARVPLGVPLFGWRLDAPGGPATAALVPRAVDGAPAAFELCWRTRYRTLDRLSCSVHGADHAAAVEDAPDGEARRIRSETGAVPWNPTPPAGTPAPPPVPHPIRYVLGSAMVPRLLVPTDGAGERATVLRSADGSGSVARLYATSPTPGWTFPDPIDSTAGSDIDGARPVELSFSAPTAYRYAVTGRVDRLVLRTAEGTRPLPGDLAVDPGAIYPLDVELLHASDGVVTVRALLRSIDGARTGYRLCWSVALGTTDRLACSVEDVPGATGHVEATRLGTTRIYR